PPRILLGGADPTETKALCKVLHRESLAVEAVLSGRDVLDRARKLRPDLIVLSLQMPHIDGVTLTRGLRAIPDFAATPIVVLAPEAGEEVRNSCRLAGATALVLRRSDSVELLDTIRSLLGPPIETKGRPHEDPDR
ncbi:MAG: response regulator, partial [Candidatus Sumerlaeia bacterium]|nr:response regulator [Candidatus Sumerlaeia bacterium]